MTIASREYKQSLSGYQRSAFIRAIRTAGFYAKPYLGAAAIAFTIAYPAVHTDDLNELETDHIIRKELTAMERLSPSAKSTELQDRYQKLRLNIEYAQLFLERGMIDAAQKRNEIKKLEFEDKLEKIVPLGVKGEIKVDIMDTAHYLYDRIKPSAIIILITTLCGLVLIFPTSRRLSLDSQKKESTD